MLSFRVMRKLGKADGFHCHHIIPTSVVEKRSLARIFGRARSAGFDPEDFASNGMHLPSTERQAIAFRLPLHRGPHRRYNELVANQISRWDALDPRDLSNQLALLQPSLKIGLRRPAVVLRHQGSLGISLIQDFRKLDIDLEHLLKLCCSD
jgi:hypothetical protein